MKKITTLLLSFSLAAALILPACLGNDKKQEAQRHQKIQKIKDAYMYGFPIVLMHLCERVMTNASERSVRMPLNQFTNVNWYATGEFKTYLKPRADVFCSFAWVELGREPVIIIVPGTERAAVFTVFDAWTNIIAKDAVNGQGNKYMLANAQWIGETPHGVTKLVSLGNMTLVSAYFWVNSLKDGVKNALPLQKSLKIIPLSRYEDKDYVPAKKRFDATIDMSSPLKQIFNMGIEDYFNLLNNLIEDNPPPETDAPFLDKIKDMHIAPGEDFALGYLPADTHEEIKSVPLWASGYFSDVDRVQVAENGWVSASFSTKEKDFYERAYNAFKNICGLSFPDTYRSECRTGNDGLALTGKNNYVFRFGKDDLDAMGGSWSLSMYNPRYSFVKNTLKKYAVNGKDTMVYNEDGSLDIYIQRKKPAKTKEKNWLPSPAGSFILVLNVFGLKDQTIQIELPSVNR